MDTIEKNHAKVESAMEPLNEKSAEEELRWKLEMLTSKDLAVFDELCTMPIKNVHSDTFIVVVCLAGKAMCRMEGNSYEVHKNDLVIGHPNLFVEDVMISIDFRCIGLVLSPAFLESLFFLGGNSYEAILASRKQPVIHLSEEEVERSKFNMDIIRTKLNDTALPHHKEVLRLLLHSLIYEFYDCLSPKLRLEEKNYGYTASEMLFKRFSHLLAQEAPYRREVGYYADKLCVTRKYLSCACKQASGKTASYLINEQTVNHIRKTLRFSDKTIKEIAMETGFHNLSFFAKYVKRELGMSPKEFRMNCGRTQAG